MRLLALATVLLFTAGSAIACPAHPEQTASNDQTVAQRRWGEEASAVAARQAGLG